MNYMTEIKLFNEYLPTSTLTPTSVALWYGLMYIFNRSGWQNELPISIATIEAQTKISRTSIYRERERLCCAGLITFSTQKGRLNGIYKLCSLSICIASQISTQSNTEMSQCGTQTDTVVSQIGTQNKKNECDKQNFVSRVVSLETNRDKMRSVSV